MVPDHKTEWSRADIIYKLTQDVTQSKFQFWGGENLRVQDAAGT